MIIILSFTYISILLLTLLTLLTLGCMVKENGRLQAAEKKQLYQTYALIIAAAVMEELALQLNGAAEWTRGIHRVVKCLDYTLTPAVGLLFVRQVTNIRESRNRLLQGVVWLLGANALLQLVSIFTGWTFFLDDQNYYHHGPLYPVYMVVYAFALVAVLLQFSNYSKKFSRQNRLSLYLLALITVVGILIQELTGGEIRIIYLALAISSSLMFIHKDEFNQQRTDMKLRDQEWQLMIDPMTGLKSAYAYSQMLSKMNPLAPLPEDLVILMLDVNGLKQTNDTLGHSAGDELIMGMSRCILDTFDGRGECYRIGGDEILVLLHEDVSEVNRLREKLSAETKAWHGKISPSGSISVGQACACDHPDLPIEKLIGIADKEMYRQKAQYYQTSGLDRRRRRSDSENAG